MADFKVTKTDKAHDVLMTERSNLDCFFSPSSVALIGATEKPNSVGRLILRNLIESPFGGVVYPINPNRTGVMGIRAYPSIAAVPEKVDLAIVVTPAKTVPGVIGECVDAGVKGAIVISAGFKEIGPEGVELERQVMAQARRGRMRIIGPNCLGLLDTYTGLNASFAPAMARMGSLGFVSQSGALACAVLDWSLKENVGFSSFVTIGSMLDIDWGDLIYHFGNDARTKSIVLYMESIGNARSFLSAAREVALTKPIIVIKAGRSEAAAKAAASHTGSLAGSDEVLDAAFRRCGVIRVDRISELFSLSEVLSKQPRPRGPRLSIITNAGGPGVLAVDALVATGGELATLAPETIQQLNTFLPPAWSHANPIDVLGDADPDRYVKAVEIAAKDPNSDGLLVILTPQAMTQPTQAAEKLRKLAKLPGKPILASLTGGIEMTAGDAILSQAGIPSFDYPDTAAHAFSYMWKYTYNLRGLYETPDVFCADEHDLKVAETGSAIIQAVRSSGRTLLTEFESKALLDTYGISTVPTKVANSPEEAVRMADSFGYPVVLKLNSETITHKTDVGGVLLNLESGDAVSRGYRQIETSVHLLAGDGHFQGVTVQPMIRLKDAYELIIGSSLDSQFGPVLLFGSGGQLVEVMKDRALALPPLNTTLARRLIEQTRIYKALKGVRGRQPVNMASLERLLVRFSRMICEQPFIKEIDINPLLASPDGLLALDARVVLHDLDVPKEKLPRTAIRPYPVQFASYWSPAAGGEVFIRPIRPEDEPGLVKFHESLSENTVYLRYFQMLKLSQRVAHDRLTRICFIDYDREMALVAEGDLDGGGRGVLGVARLSKISGTEDAEFALLITDKYQRHGLGAELLRRLIEIARAEDVRMIAADMLTINEGMRRLCAKLGFQIEPTDDPNVLRASLQLREAN